MEGAANRELWRNALTDPVDEPPQYGRVFFHNSQHVLISLKHVVPDGSRLKITAQFRVRETDPAHSRLRFTDSFIA